MENFYRKFAIPSSQTLAMFRIPEKSTKELKGRRRQRRISRPKPRRNVVPRFPDAGAAVAKISVPVGEAPSFASMIQAAVGWSSLSCQHEWLTTLDNHHGPGGNCAVLKRCLWWKKETVPSHAN
jgi:hypothetical protein